MENRSRKVKKMAGQMLLIIAALTVFAFGVALFILPLDMIAAGTTGLALVVEHVWGIPLSVFIALFNVVMFAIGWKELGREFALSTLVASFYYPFILDQAIRIVGDHVITSDPMLCAIFSGIITGVCLGVVIRAGASTGGMDIPPLVLKKRFGIPVSMVLYLMDFIVLAAQLAFRDTEKILYALVMVLVYTTVLDRVLVSGVKQMQVKIISDKYERINQLIQEKLDRGTTLFNIEGGHTRKDSYALLTVVSGRELTKLNDLVMQEDDKAFMIVNQVGEVRGRGFTLSKYSE